METQSGECGFICNCSKYKNIWVKGVASLIKMQCVKRKMSYLQFVSILFVAKKQKRKNYVRKCKPCVVLLYLVNFLDGFVKCIGNYFVLD